MAHEKSISVGRAPKVFLLPTVVGGEDIGAEAAMKLFEAGELAPLAGPFKTIKAADEASKKRSKAFKDPAKVLFPSMK